MEHPASQNPAKFQKKKKLQKDKNKFINGFGRHSKVPSGEKGLNRLMWHAYTTL